ncbi:bile acid:sodium symporter family protein [Penaeicola halotolerans]|uniref:bile acid:sodium symporter family protein n=1 Tax=Penaeicola halotolerans TaxID=2793196 RepID=UPI001CF8680A|nr:bile acid:sodium symporter family protein [Penaeicola halotolerans]
MNQALDSANLQFNQGSLLLLNLSLAIIMFGVALDLKISDFKYIAKSPRSFFIGVISQFVLLPLVTYLLVIIFTPQPSIALGMMLVAACPGGNVSNFISHMAKGNTALSVSLTAFSTVFAIFLTPLNFSLWASLYTPTADMLQTISLDYEEVFFTVLIILGIPLLVGMLVRHYLPAWSTKASKILKPLSILIFAGFVAVAFANNYGLFLKFIWTIFAWVLIQNLAALSTGYTIAKLGRLNLADTKTITIETGIQNSGLALVIIFTYFDGLGGMAIIAAWWGIWHIIAGMGLATFWSEERNKR